MSDPRVPGAVSDRLVLAVDCSTTAAKVVASDGEGRVVSSGSRPLDLSRPGAGLHEQDADQWWTATVGALAETVSGLGPDARAVAAVAVTHQRESFVLLDGAGRPLRPAICWLDSRAGEEIAELGTDRVRDLSGKPPDVTPALYKLAWLARHEPGVLRGAETVQEVHGFLAGRLTGHRTTSTGSADSLGLLDLRRGTWSPELTALAGLRADQLPGLAPPGRVLAPLTPEVAARLGLSGPVPLVSGIGDGQAAGLGANALDDDVAYVNLGTSLVMGVVSHEYLTGPAFRTLAGAEPGTFVLETVLNAAAYLADWFRREFGDPGAGGAVDPALDEAAAALPEGSDGLLTVPYWNCAQTPYWDPHARGITVGWHGGHTRAHLYRSLLEGVAFELRLHLDGLEARTGRRIRVLRTTGGGSRSALWTRIVADVTGREVQRCAGGEISARGAAVLAWTGAIGGTVAEASAAMAAFDDTVSPRPDATARYEEFSAVQRRVYPRLREVLTDLAGVVAH